MMAIDGEYLRAFKLRSAASQLLLVILIAIVLYGESSAFTTWQVRTVGTALAMALFLAFNLFFLFAADEGDRRLKLLLWIEAALVICMFLTATNIERMILFGGYWVLYLPSVYRLPASLSFTAALIVVLQVIAFTRGQWETARMIVVVPAYGLVLFVSYLAVSERRLYRQTRALNDELKVAQLQLAEASRQNERLRIAREIHDVLGHQMTAQILTLEVATHQTQGVALSHVEQSLALAKMMLGDLRNAVSDLRESAPTDFPDALRNLLAGIPKLETSMEQQQGLAINDPQTAATLLRCVQEAATNTLRHSDASSFRVALHAEKDELVLELSDNGTGSPAIIPGNGLAGMRERVESLAGKLDWQCTHRGFELRISLPLRQGASS